ncbi:helix-turn-helix domain-containing protein [Bradyrhizobium guangdongense]
MERVAAFLRDMTDRSMKAGVLQLPMSRRDIAIYLGLTIERVPRDVPTPWGRRDRLPD